MKREELLKSREYWITKIQLDLFELIHNYMKENNLNKTQLAAKLGVSKGYISQILNGNFDHKVSKLVELSLAFDRVPVLEYEKIVDYLADDLIGLTSQPRRQVVIQLNYSMKQIIEDVNDHKDYGNCYTNLNDLYKELDFHYSSTEFAKNIDKKCYN